MGFLSFFGPSPLGIALKAILVIVIAAVIFVGANVILALSGGPGPCTPGGGPITVNAANADGFQAKWDAFDGVLDLGSPSSVTFNESEVSSFVDREFGSPFSDPRICIHDGFGEGTAMLDILGLSVKIKVTGNVDLSGEHPVAEIDDIEVGNIPGFITDIIEDFFTDLIDDETNRADLAHTYTPILTDGNAQIDGAP